MSKVPTFTPQEAEARAKRLRQLVEMERTISPGGELSQARQGMLAVHERRKHDAIPVSDCHWCEVLAADAAVDRSRYVVG